MFANIQNCNVPKPFCTHLVYLFNESKGRLIFPPKSFLFLSKEFQKQPYNLIIRFTLVIINVCVSKYAYAAVAIFKWHTENIYIIITLSMYQIITLEISIE